MTRVVTPVMLKVRNKGTPADDRWGEKSQIDPSSEAEKRYALLCSRPTPLSRLAALRSAVMNALLSRVSYFFLSQDQGKRLQLFKAKNENFFTYLLTEKRSCGMIGRAWIIPAVGMRMQRRRLPLGLLSR